MLCRHGPSVPAGPSGPVQRAARAAGGGAGKQAVAAALCCAQGAAPLGSLVCSQALVQGAGLAWRACLCSGCRGNARIHPNSLVPLLPPFPSTQEPGLAARKPALFEQCLELLYELAASPDTGAAHCCRCWGGPQLDRARCSAWRAVPTWVGAPAAAVPVCSQFLLPLPTTTPRRHRHSGPAAWLLCAAGPPARQRGLRASAQGLRPARLLPAPARLAAAGGVGRVAAAISAWIAAGLHLRLACLPWLPPVAFAPAASQATNCHFAMPIPRHLSCTRWSCTAPTWP